MTTQPRRSSSSRRSMRTRAWLVEPTSRGTASRPKRCERSVTWGEQPRHPLAIGGRQRRERRAHGAAGEADGVHRGLHARGAKLAYDLLVQRNERFLEGSGAGAVSRAEGGEHVDAAAGRETGEREDPAVAAQLQGGAEERPGADEDRPLRHGRAVGPDVLHVSGGILDAEDVGMGGELPEHRWG